MCVPVFLVSLGLEAPMALNTAPLTRTLWTWRLDSQMPSLDLAAEAAKLTLAMGRRKQIQRKTCGP